MTLNKTAQIFVQSLFSVDPSFIFSVMIPCSFNCIEQNYAIIPSYLLMFKLRSLLNILHPTPLKLRPYGAVQIHLLLLSFVNIHSLQSLINLKI